MDSVQTLLLLNLLHTMKRYNKKQYILDDINFLAKGLKVNTEKIENGYKVQNMIFVKKYGGGGFADFYYALYA